MLTTPKDPAGSATNTVDTCSSPAPDEPDPALETARLRHEVALLTVRQEIEQVRAATASLTQATAAPAERPSTTQDSGTVASWMAHQQLGVAVETIGDAVARALGVVPKAERASMSAAVTDALVKSAREHLDRAAAAGISGVPRSALERACMAALDRQAQLSIDEARRRNSLEDEADVAALQAKTPLVGANQDDALLDDTLSDGQDASSARPIRVLVTADPLVAGSDWHAQHLAAQIGAHVSTLQRLSAQTVGASEDLETTLDCWVRGGASGVAEPPAGRPSAGWSSAGLSSTDESSGDGSSEGGPSDGGSSDGASSDGGSSLGALAIGAASAGAWSTAAQATAPLTLGLQLLELARSDLTTSRRTVSTGHHELVMRGAAALATNLGSQGTVIADELTALNPCDSPLMTALNDLLQHRADLASSVAGLAGIVSFARALAGLDEFDVDGAAQHPRASRDDGAARHDRAAQHDGAAQHEAPMTRPTLEPGLRELGRQALLHERLVTHVVETLRAIDRDAMAWVHPGDNGEAPPLLAAVGRERLHAGRDQFTHVLVLQDEGLTADVFSRRSIVGDSGRLTHVGSASVSWLLIDIDSGAVVEGGQAAPARTLLQDTGSGRTSSVNMSAHSSAPLPWDAQHTLELALKFFALTAGLAALVLSIVAIANVFLT